ncbi:MAG: hypothetical protein ACP5D1_02020 [Bacteroidales bacterium]
MKKKMPRKPVKGFSSLPREEKLGQVARLFKDPQKFVEELNSFRHPKYRELLEGFSENTLAQYPLPYGVVPNVIVNGTMYMVPVVTEESSVVAAAAKSAGFWSGRGGFHARVLGTTKVGQVHFTWKGDFRKLQDHFPELKEKLVRKTSPVTRNMVKRGGGIREIRLLDMTRSMENYYQLMAEFETADSMGANFINTCMEEMASALVEYIGGSGHFHGEEKKVNVIMAILSNYTPDCLVECRVETGIGDLGEQEGRMTAEYFARKFEQAVMISRKDTYRAATHNKGIFNGIDAVALATGNDFRAIEACGHAWAARSGNYSGLTDIDLGNNMFRYSLTLPLALGTVGGLTSLHPLAKRSLEMLGNPRAGELMMIAASVGLANNFGAIRSLVTRGIQAGHMKMHLSNMLNRLGATPTEKEKARAYFSERKVSYRAVETFLLSLRKQHHS